MSRRRKREREERSLLQNRLPVTQSYSAGEIAETLTLYLNDVAK